MLHFLQHLLVSIKRVSDLLETRDHEGRIMFMSLPDATDGADLRDDVKNQGRKEVLDLLLGQGVGDAEDEIFVTMMSWGVILVLVVLYWVT